MLRILLLALSLLVVGCAASGAGPDLSGPAWLVEDLDGHGVIDGAEPTMAFTAEGQVSGSTGCNSYFASYRVEHDRVAIGNVATTKRACSDTVMEQERRFLDILAAAERVTLQEGGWLVLEGPGGALRLSRADAS